MANFRKVPKLPGKLTAKKPKRQQIINFYGNTLLRQEILRRMGKKANDSGSYYICLNHRFEVVTKRINVKFPKAKSHKDKSGKDKSEDYTIESRAFKLLVPEDCGPQSSMKESTESRGLGNDRDLVRRVTEMQTTIRDGTLPPNFSFEEIEEDLASTKPTSPKEELEHSQEEL